MRYDQYKVEGDGGEVAYVGCRRCGQEDDVQRLDHAMRWAEEHELVCAGDDKGDDVVAEAAQIQRETGVNPLAMGCAGDD